LENFDKYYRSYKYMQELLGADFTHNYITQNLSDADKGNDTLTGKVNEKVIDMDWVVAIEDALPYIEKAIEEQRRFIKETREVYRIDKARIINKDSVKHLSQHTNYIAKVEGDKVTPNKILTVEREESFEIYENRFLITLLREALRFVADKYSRMVKAPTDTYNKVEMTRNLQLNNQKIDFKVEYINEIKDNKADDLDVKEYEKLSNFDRVRRIRKKLNALLSTQLMKDIANCIPVRPPILHTNLMMKNPNFKAALDLYTYLQAYKKPGFEIVGKEHTGKMDKEVQEALYMSLGFQHFMLSMATNEGLKKMLEQRYNEENEGSNISADIRERRRQELIDSIRQEEMKIRLKEIREREATIRKLMAEVKDLKREIAERDRKIDQLQQKIHALEEDITALKAELDKVKAALAKALQEIKELKAKIAELEAEIVQLKAEIEALTAKVAELEEIKAQLEAKVAELEQIVEEQKARIAELEEIKARLEAEVAQLKAKVAELEAIKAQLEAKIVELENTVAQQKARIEELEEIKARLESEVAQQKVRIAELEEIKLNLETKVNNLETENAQQKATIAEQSATIAQQSENISGLEKSLSTAYDNIQSLNDTVSQRDSEIAEKNTTIDGLNTNVANLSSELEQEKEAHKTEVEAEIQSHLDHVKKLNDMFEAEREQLRAESEKALLNKENSHSKAVAKIKNEHNAELVKAEKRYEADKAKIRKECDNRVKSAQRDAEKKAEVKVKEQVEKAKAEAKKAAKKANDAASKFKDEFKKEKANIGLFKQDFAYGGLGIQTVMAVSLMQTELTQDEVLSKLAGTNKINCLYMVKDKKRTAIYMGSFNDLTLVKSLKVDADINAVMSAMSKYLTDADKAGAYVTYKTMSKEEIAQVEEKLGITGFETTKVFHNKAQKSGASTLGIYFYRG